MIAETSNPLLEQALSAKLRRKDRSAGHLGKLEPVAIRLGLLQNSLKPGFVDPQLVLFAADHGLAVDGIHTVQSQATDEVSLGLLEGRLPLALFARQMGFALSIVDCGMASRLHGHERLLQRKIAHGTRNTRLGSAMSLDQAHASIRAGMEIGDALPGNLLACAGIGVASHEVAAMVLSRLTEVPARELLSSGPDMNPDLLAHLLAVAHSAQTRHRDVVDPVEVLAAFGGFETGVMVGAMLVAASKRHLILVDGITACAALMVASRISAPVTDYCVFCRSSSHHGLDQALAQFHASSLLDLGMDTTDGTGACLAFPLVSAAAALLTDSPDAGDSAPRVPTDFAPTAIASPGYDALAPTRPDDLG